MELKEKIIIIGGGLSGLTLAYLLSKRNIHTTILEASSRLGGRIQTIKGINGTPLELGATWFSDVHKNLLSLVEELGLKKFPQFSNGVSLFQTKSFEPAQKFFVPEAETPSYRLAGGTQILTDTLANKLSRENICLNAKVSTIRQTADGISLETLEGKIYNASKAIVCIPPQLAISTVHFDPALPDHTVSLLPTVQTWMAGAIKFTLEYEKPFWRNEGYSGMLYSHAGIIVEMYDHTNFEETKYGLTGFLNGGVSGYSQDVRKEFVIKQLVDLLGEKAANPLAYYDKVWSDEFVVSGDQIIQRPHQNNGHPLLHKSYMNGNLYFSGTETASEFAGYMEGAVVAAKLIADKL